MIKNRNIIQNKIRLKMESRFRKLPKDILFKMALDLDFPEILNLCKSDEKIYEKLCKDQNSWFWVEKLKNDFYVNYNNIETSENPQSMYFNLNKDFDNALIDIYSKGYPDKLKSFN